MKIQIALEFIIVFSFVLAMFLLLFSIIATQRAGQLGQQTFSQLQLIAQNIAQQINIAYASGNGYSANVGIQGAIGITLKNITVTKNGVVIVYAKVGLGVIDAVAYTNAKNIYAPNVLPPNSIALQNSFGQICIDINCIVSTTQASQQSGTVVLTTQVAHFGKFNGQTSSINSSGPDYEIYPISNFEWIRPAGSFPATSDTSHLETISVFDASSITFAGSYFVLGITQNGNLSFMVNGVMKKTGLVLPLNRWSFVGYTTTSGANPTVTVYLNTASQSFASPASVSLASSNKDWIIGWAGGQITHFNGSIADVQAYNSTLSQLQEGQLFQSGITGSPLSANLVGWWPLNGDVADYSGYGSTGNAIAPLIFPTMAELFAKVTTVGGAASYNTLVGFTTSYANLSQIQTAINNTNLNGIATAFLTQLGNSGYANLRATAYSANPSALSNLAAWWPLNQGQGSSAYDISGKNNTATMYNSSWNRPNYVGVFDGKSSMINLPPATPVNPGGTFTVSVWFKATGSGVIISNSNAIQPNIPTSYNSPILYVNSNGNLAGGDYNGGVPFNSLYHVSDGRWYFAAITQSGSTQKVYLNGVQLATSTGTLHSFSNYNWTVGEGYTTLWPATNNGLFYFNGSISNVQFYGTALTANQIQLLYLEGLSGSPLFYQGLSGWFPLNGDANDYSGKGNNGIILGNMLFADPHVNQTTNQTNVLYPSFNGISYVQIPYSSSLNIGDPYLSISAWVQAGALGVAGCGSSGSPACTILSKNNSYGMAIDSNGKLYWILNTSSPGWIYIKTNATVPAFPNMTHIVLTYNGTYVNTYENGLLVNSTTGNGIVGNPSNPLRIGAGGSPSTVAKLFSGNILNIQIYNQLLTRQQVYQLYQEGITGFPIARVSLSGWWPLNGDSNDYSGLGDSGTATNLGYRQASGHIPSLESSNNGYGVVLNGQGAYLEQSSGFRWLSGSANAFSISLWVYPKANNGVILDELGQPQLNSGFHKSFIELVNGNVSMRWGANCQTLPSIPLNSWSNIAMTYNGVNFTGYINGVNLSSVKVPFVSPGATAYYPAGAYDPSGCSGSANYFNGYVSNIQFYNTSLNLTQVYQQYVSQTPPYGIATVPLGIVP